MKSLLVFINEVIGKENVELRESEKFLTYEINGDVNGGYDLIVCDDESFIISSYVDVYGDISVSNVSETFIEITRKCPIFELERDIRITCGMCNISKLQRVIINKKNTTIIQDRKVVK